VIDYHDIPADTFSAFGATSREWIGSMVNSVIEASYRSGKVEMEPEHLQVMDHLRDFMFERVYLSPETERQKQRAIQVIQDLVGYFRDNPAEVAPNFAVPGSDALTTAIDYVAGMTDRFALTTWDTLFRPQLDF
jgi:dGTPase